MWRWIPYFFITAFGIAMLPKGMQAGEVFFVILLNQLAGALAVSDIKR